MKKNMSSTDQGIRFVIALVIAVLYFSGLIHGTLAIVLGMLAIAFLITSLLGWCPSYLPLGLTTRKPSA